MAVLSATALIYAHGLDRGVWNEVWGIARPADAVWGSALGTGLGAWFGAIPIPLDWYVYVHTALQMRNTWLTRYMKGPTLAGIPNHDSRWSLHRIYGWLFACSHSICVRQACQIHFGGERDRKED